MESQIDSSSAVLESEAGGVATANYSAADVEKAAELKRFLFSTVKTFPYTAEIEDWTGDVYELGLGKTHWRGGKFRVHFKTPKTGEYVLALKPMEFLDAYVRGEVDIKDNMYMISEVRNHLQLDMSKFEFFMQLIKHRAFQDTGKAAVNVTSHYDISQEALNGYLDEVYMSYSCGMYENPYDLDIDDALRVGKGQEDDWDSLEKAQWRKFKDAVDFLQPEKGDTMLDVGCGYGGQLVVALENHDFGKVVGWTHSKNQVDEGSKYLEKFDKDSWELHQGDYREDDRVFDHITSTGMISHVGPRGLVPYVKNVRKRIKTGGRYLHHALMIPRWRTPQDQEPGIAFNKKYVWPGFHWFTIGDHINALERNGFEIQGSRNLSPHYVKTGLGWAERFMSKKEHMMKEMGEQTHRAWWLYMCGGLEAMRIKKIHVYRVYCVAV